MLSINPQAFAGPDEARNWRSPRRRVYNGRTAMFHSRMDRILFRVLLGVALCVLVVYSVPYVQSGIASWTYRHDYRSRLQDAVYARKSEEARRLLEANPELRRYIDRDGLTKVAINCGSVATLKVLLDNGAGIDKGLLSFASCLRSPEVVQLLINRGANVKETDAIGTTPLMLAALRGNVPVMETLIRAGGDMNATNRYGCNALQYAYIRIHRDAVKLLLDSGSGVSDTPPSDRDASEMDNADRTVIKLYGGTLRPAMPPAPH
jgi:hypothetical protein